MNIARIVFAALLCAIPCWSNAAAVNLVLNPGLELAAADWHTRGMVIEENAIWAHTGLWAARTNCVGAGCLSTFGFGSFLGQTLATTQGQYYDLSFWVRSTSSVAEFSVFWDGVMIADHLNPSGPMLNYTYSGLAATGSATSFEIHGRGDGYVIAFDDISVQAGMVPEPLGYAMLFAGLGVLAIALRRRQRWSMDVRD